MKTSFPLYAWYAAVGAALLFVELPANAGTLTNQTCQTTGTSTSGSCGSYPGCGGSFTQIQYDGCTQCVSSTGENAACTTIDPSGQCQERQRTATCTKCTGDGCQGCIQRPYSSWSTWTNVDMKDCFNGRSRRFDRLGSLAVVLPSTASKNLNNVVGQPWR